MQDDQSIKKNKKSLNNYAHYSGIVFQMAAVILAGTFGGIKLDRIVQFRFPLFTVVLSFFSVLLAIYLVIKDLLRKKEP